MEMESFRDLIPENSTVGSISRTDFIGSFFSRTNRKKIHGSYEKYFLAVSLFTAILVFAVLIGCKTDKYTALTSSVAILITSVPLCSAVVNMFPLYQAQRKAYDMQSAVIGAQSVNEHSEISIISVYDRDIFPPDQVKFSRMQVYGTNNRIEVIMQHCCAVFEKLNMAAAESFRASTVYESNFNTNVDIISIAENGGVCFVSNGRKLFMGNEEYISNIGLRIKEDQHFDEQFQKSSGSILILSSDSEILAKIYLKYEIVPDFFDILKNLNRAKICLAIRTFDPSIDTELLHRIANFKKFPIKVIKLKELKHVYRVPGSMDSGIASKSSLKSLIKTLLLCAKTQNVIKSNILIEIIAFVLGVALTSLIAVLGIIHGEVWTLNPGYILLFQGFWILPILFLSGFTPN
jgi:hypothetical protein